MCLVTLSDRYIFLGEWCYAQHSVFYNRLPDWFLAFDMYDRESLRFLSSTRRDRMIEKLQVSKVPSLARGKFSFPELDNLLSQSKLADQPAEGIYLRFDQGDWLGQRAKLVRPAFVQAIDQHWSRSTLKLNRLRSEVRG